MGWGISRIGRALALAFMAAPAMAAGSVAIPEPTDFALFALAVAGLIIGRQSSRKPPSDSGT